VVTVVCAWCEALIVEGEGSQSHGICEPCAANLERSYLKSKFPPRKTRRRRAGPEFPTLPLPGFALG
jgi:hypothetical protein